MARDSCVAGETDLVEGTGDVHRGVIAALRASVGHEERGPEVSCDIVFGLWAIGLFAYDGVSFG